MRRLIRQRHDVVGRDFQRYYADLKVNRQAFVPLDLAVLMVGESPPRTRTFFYHANSRLFHHTRRAFAEIVPGAPGEAQFLPWFRAQRCYIVDLLDVPPQITSATDHPKALQEGHQRLVNLIRTKRPRTVISIKKNRESIVRRAVELAGYSPRFVSLPFPSHGHQGEFERGLAAVVQDLFASGTLAADIPLLRIGDSPGMINEEWAARILATPWLELDAGRYLWRRQPRNDSEADPVYHSVSIGLEDVEELFRGLADRGFFRLDARCADALVTDAGSTTIYASWRGHAHAVSCYAFQSDRRDRQWTNEESADLRGFTECFHWPMNWSATSA